MLSLALPVCAQVNVRAYGAKGDGHSDDGPAIQRALAAHRQVLFPSGTYGIRGTLTIPNKTQILGVGRGDPGINTVIKALPGFPSNAPLVRMGDINPSFGVRIENLTLDGSGIAPVCLENRNSEELSAGRDLLLLHCTSAPLYIAGSGAQNSGPFTDLEIYPTATRADTVCVRIDNVISFRGIQGLTCNAGPGKLRPEVALHLTGGSRYSDIHVEHFATAFSLGDSAQTADGMTIINAEFGPAVDTGVSINARPGNQNITVMGLSCVGCKMLLADHMSGKMDNHSSLGFYALGDGPPHQQPVLTDMSR